MTPLILILWALAIGGAWLILSFCGLIGKWIECRMDSLTLERKSDATAEPDHRNGSGRRSNGAGENAPPPDRSARIDANAKSNRIAEVTRDSEDMGIG